MNEKIHTYEGEDITISYDVNRCIHAAECVRGLNKVFNPENRPWIQPQHASAEEIREVIERCPTGALHYKSHDQTEEIPQEIPSIHPAANGPLYVRGTIEIQDHDGTSMLKDTRVALCRCGHSAHKPFCDNSHKNIPFEASSSFDAGITRSSMEETDEDQHILRLKLSKNGPILIDGIFKLQSDETPAVMQSGPCALCRCGGSGNKPFCDGTHKRIGFQSI